MANLRRGPCHEHKIRCLGRIGGYVGEISGHLTKADSGSGFCVSVYDKQEIFGLGRNAELATQNVMATPPSG